MSDTPTTQTTFAPGDRVHIAYTFFAVGGLPATVLEVHPGAIKVEVDRYPGGRISVAPEHLTMLNGTGDVMGTKKRARTAPPRFAAS